MRLVLWLAIERYEGAGVHVDSRPPTPGSANADLDEFCDEDHACVVSHLHEGRNRAWRGTKGPDPAAPGAMVSTRPAQVGWGAGPTTVRMWPLPAKATPLWLRGIPWARGRRA